MNTIVSLWIAAPAFGTALALEWAMLRRKHRSELSRQQAKYAQQQQVLTQHMQQAKRQIGQLQHELAAARLQIKRLPVAAAAAAAQTALERTIDDAREARRQLPTDGFAETRPFRHSDHARSILLR